MKQNSITLIILYILISCSLFQISIGEVIYKREPQQQPPQQQPQDPKVAPPQQQPQDPKVAPPPQQQPQDPKVAPPPQQQPQDPKVAPPPQQQPQDPKVAPTPTTPQNPALPSSSDQAVRVKVTFPTIIPLIFKIGKKYQFNWTYTANFDPVYAPKALNVYTIKNIDADKRIFNFSIGSNLPPETTSIVWDTSLQTNPTPPAGAYLLYIWDERGPSPINTSVGQLEPFVGSRFQLYTPKPKVNLADYTCAVCDGNSPLTRAQENKPYLPIAVLGGILVLTVLFVIFVKVKNNPSTNPTSTYDIES
ncbi:15500_t:CDS:2 [Entrophospora sp. SA101]|nr:15500_t:CDS:2 [Entrophospora sp. SA101]CAJ0824932.1 21015_t:CDS:2 [Entrophospora sp. SA101]